MTGVWSGLRPGAVSDPEGDITPSVKRGYTKLSYYMLESRKKEPAR